MGLGKGQRENGGRGVGRDGGARGRGCNGGRGQKWGLPCTERQVKRTTNQRTRSMKEYYSTIQRHNPKNPNKIQEAKTICNEEESCKRAQLPPKGPPSKDLGVKNIAKDTLTEGIGRKGGKWNEEKVLETNLKTSSSDKHKSKRPKEKSNGKKQPTLDKWVFRSMDIRYREESSNNQLESEKNHEKDHL